MAENREKLFDQFAPVSTETWKAKVVADLKGADFDKKLVWRTNEGFNVQPMYRAEDIENPKDVTPLVVNDFAFSFASATFSTTMF